jgi:hypothetical protein
MQMAVEHFPTDYDGLTLTVYLVTIHAKLSIQRYNFYTPKGTIKIQLIIADTHNHNKPPRQ